MSPIFYGRPLPNNLEWDTKRNELAHELAEAMIQWKYGSVRTLKKIAKDGSTNPGFEKSFVIDYTKNIHSMTPFEQLVAYISFMLGRGVLSAIGAEFLVALTEQEEISVFRQRYLLAARTGETPGRWDLTPGRSQRGCRQFSAIHSFPMPTIADLREMSCFENHFCSPPSLFKLLPLHEHIVRLMGKVRRIISMMQLSKNDDEADDSSDIVRWTREFQCPNCKKVFQSRDHVRSHLSNRIMAAGDSSMPTNCKREIRLIACKISAMGESRCRIRALESMAATVEVEKSARSSMKINVLVPQPDGEKKLLGNKNVVSQCAFCEEGFAYMRNCGVARHYRMKHMQLNIHNHIGDLSGLKPSS